MREVSRSLAGSSRQAILRKGRSSWRKWRSRSCCSPARACCCARSSACSTVDLGAPAESGADACACRCRPQRYPDAAHGASRSSRSCCRERERRARRRGRGRQQRPAPVGQHGPRSTSRRAPQRRSGAGPQGQRGLHRARSASGWPPADSSPTPTSNSAQPVALVNERFVKNRVRRRAAARPDRPGAQAPAAAVQRS